MSIKVLYGKRAKQLGGNLTQRNCNIVIKSLGPAVQSFTGFSSSKIRSNVCFNLLVNKRHVFGQRTVLQIELRLFKSSVGYTFVCDRSKVKTYS